MGKARTGREADFLTECRTRFLYYCARYRASVFHADKRDALEKAYEAVDAWLDYRDLDSL